MTALAALVTAISMVLCANVFVAIWRTYRLAFWLRFWYDGLDSIDKSFLRWWGRTAYVSAMVLVWVAG